MELNKLQTKLITERFELGDDGFSVTWDANLFTGEVGRRMARTYREAAERFESQTIALKAKADGEKSLVEIADEVAASMELNAAMQDLDREMYADILAVDRYGILQDWGITSGGQHVAPTFEVLIKQPAPALRDIFQFCREQSNPKKVETPMTSKSPTTVETTSGGSASLATLSPESPTM